MPETVCSQVEIIQAVGRAIRKVRGTNGFENLQNFCLREGHSNPRADYIEENFKLGRWVSKQRSRQSSLSEQQIGKLSQLDFIWDAREAAWFTNLNYLSDFHKENGHCLVPVAYEVDGLKLGTWVLNRRKDHAKMGDKRKQMLDDLGFIWDASKDKT